MLVTCHVHECNESEYDNNPVPFPIKYSLIVERSTYVTLSEVLDR